MALSKAQAAQRYRGYGDLAMQKSQRDLTHQLNIDYKITRWNSSVIDTIEMTWGEDRVFDWRDIYNSCKSEPTALGLAIWSQEELCAVGVMTLTQGTTWVRFVERNRNGSNALKGKVLLILLDAATNYCQASGRRLVKLEPLNDRLVEYYVTSLGFELVDPPKGSRYCVLEV